MANTYHGLDAVGSLESPWAPGSWKFGRSSSGQRCPVHLRSCTLTISMQKGLQTEAGFWVRWAVGVMLHVTSVAVHISVGHTYPRHLPDGIWSFTARTPSSRRE